MIQRFNLKVLSPCFARSFHIGVYGGTHATPEEHNRLFGGKEYCKENIENFEYDKVSYIETLMAQSKIMKIQQNTTMSVEDLLQRIRAEVARRKASLAINGQTSLKGFETPTTEMPMQPTQQFDLLPLNLSMLKTALMTQPQPLDLPRPTPLTDQPSYHVRDFLPFNEAEFIRMAHRAILKREADEDNMANFLRSWHEGASKVYLLGQMRYSEEGEQRAVPITGLRARFLLERAYRLPLIGYLLRWFVSLLTLPKRLRTLSRFADRVLVNEQHLTVHVNGINHTIKQFYAQLSQFMTRNDGNLRVLQEIVNTINANYQALRDDHKALSTRLDRYQQEKTAAIHAEAQLAYASYQTLMTCVEELNVRLERNQQEIASAIRAEAQAINESRQAFVTHGEIHNTNKIQQELVTRVEELNTRLARYQNETASAIRIESQAATTNRENLAQWLTRIDEIDGRLHRAVSVTHALTHRANQVDKVLSQLNDSKVVGSESVGAEAINPIEQKQVSVSRHDDINPLTSVIIPTWNGGKFIKRCLDSLREYLTAPYEVIVVDNASEDLTVDIVSCYSEVKLIQNPFNMGFGKAVNQGMRAAHPNSPVLFWLNQDAYAHSDWLTPILKRLKANPKVGIVGCKILTSDGKLHHAGACLIEPRMDGLHYTEEQAVDAHFDYMTGAAFALRRECYCSVGDIDEQFFPAYYEDTDYCLRAQAAGWQLAYEPKAVIIHKIHQSSLNDYELQANSNVQRIRFIHKHKTNVEWLETIWLPAERSMIRLSNSLKWLHVMMHSYWQFRDDLATQHYDSSLGAWWIAVMNELVTMTITRSDELTATLESQLIHNK